MVLKPFYNKKKIGKDSYKDIMRKCVPKVSSVNGLFNLNLIYLLIDTFFVSGVSQ